MRTILLALTTLFVTILHGQTDSQIDELKPIIKQYMQNYVIVRGNTYISMSFDDWQTNESGNFVVSHTYKEKAKNSLKFNTYTYLVEVKKTYKVLGLWTKEGYAKSLELRKDLEKFREIFKSVEQKTNESFGIGAINVLGKTKEEIKSICSKFQVNTAKEPDGGLSYLNGDKELNYDFENEKCTKVIYAIPYNPNDLTFFKYLTSTLPFIENKEKGGYDFVLKDYYAQAFTANGEKLMVYVLGKE